MQNVNDIGNWDRGWGEMMRTYVGTLYFPLIFSKPIAVLKELSLLI